MSHSLMDIFQRTSGHAECGLLLVFFFLLTLYLECKPIGCRVYVKFFVSSKQAVFFCSFPTPIILVDGGRDIAVPEPDRWRFQHLFPLLSKRSTRALWDGIIFARRTSSTPCQPRMTERLKTWSSKSVVRV
jgi:hypothetical protein